MYREDLFEFSVSSEGIPDLQKHFIHNELILKGIHMLSSCGGGLEMVALCLITFLAGKRAKFFYYLTAFCIDKSLINVLKLVYSYPRPFMVTQNIHCISCSHEFGNPSGHSSAAALFTILLYFDIFYGIPAHYFLQ